MTHNSVKSYYIKDGFERDSNTTGIKTSKAVRSHVKITGILLLIRQ
jgi:hypothetical protein